MEDFEGFVLGTSITTQISGVPACSSYPESGTDRPPRHAATTPRAPTSSLLLGPITGSSTQENANGSTDAANP